MRRALAVFLLMLGSMPATAQWTGFYTPSDAEAGQGVVSGSVSQNGVCIREILLAQMRYQIPGNLLLAIGLQESGMYRNGELTIWPWTANAAGVGRYFETEEEAIFWVRQQQASGTSSVDVGCMQINMHWHPEAFENVTEGFDPRRNVAYAAQYLLRLYNAKGDWTQAAGSYHSKTEQYQTAYLERLDQNIKVANARLDDFRQMAGAVNTRGDGSGQGGRMPTSGVFWTADLGNDAAEGQGGRSLFGPGTIQPILPTFSKGS
ncbi:lytic transglycosylase domain-containing protein [Pseudooceanicola sp. C21-150M6]|uniref:lytic transglycosylase domain-containing protein n=1 Tax=Pseudooceanicola sp. C21-150M6 TaxID=3434355 RepID=UPI003D7F69F9